jgi:hypothetical protein
MLLCWLLSVSGRTRVNERERALETGGRSASLPRGLRPDQTNRVEDAPIRSRRSRFFRSFSLVPLVSFWLLGLSIALTACNNENITVYRIPKENNQVSMEKGSGNLAPPPPTNPASWTKPDSWSEKALSEMRIGSFEVTATNGESADISITAFPGDAGGLESNVNRWREQVHQPVLEAEQLAQSWQEETVDGVPTIIVDLQSPAGIEKVSAILGAVMRTIDRTWFVKMTGPPDLLKAQKDNFLGFVRSFHFPSTPQEQQPQQEEPPASKVKSTNDR